MIKKIIGWVIMVAIILGVFAIEVARTMNELQCSLPMAIGVTGIFVLAIIGVVALFFLALSWITG